MRSFYEDGPLVVATAREHDAAAAAAKLRRELPACDYAAVLVFFSPSLGPDASPRRPGEFGGAPVFGCTTAGELGPEGFTDGGAVALGFRARDFAIVAKPIVDIDAAALDARSRRDQRNARASSTRREAGARAHNRFGLCWLTDSASTRRRWSPPSAPVSTTFRSSAAPRATA